MGEASYIRGPGLRSYADASTYCQSFGSELPSIHSEEQMEEAIQLCDGLSGCWIGLTDIDNEGEWKWEDLSMITVQTQQMEFIPGQVDNQTIVEVMKIVFSDGTVERMYGKTTHVPKDIFQSAIMNRLALFSFQVNSACCNKI